ncbi:multi-sensor signal transduction multi-kinase [Calothrix sp. NIES-4071]|nr:multi-sensor signal transduction multi-kinase [Calothrix sp. NIES-4071]BAZ61832.1 multi-sensor signal transduction multi-kinase [Calothrix sp. NIES-4105]
MLSAINLSGYEITEVIDEGLNTIIYRGVSQLHKQNVILKVLAAEYPTLEQIARLKHEHILTKNLDLEGIVKVLGLENHHKRLILVLQDFGGISLKKFLYTEKLSIEYFVSIAVQLARALVSLHSHHIIHKDIKPSNIIINPQSGQVKITDFGIASRLDKYSAQLTNPNQIEGTLGYVSPEQTGRMNRVVDYRSDFYSLGVTFYEILSGQLPFTTLDPLEIIYCHLARQPKPIQELNPEVSAPIAAIVTKLMAKNAEDRYQTGVGLLADLEFYLDHIQSLGDITQFIPGKKDRAAQLLIPQKLYGREQEISMLLAAFDRTSQGDSEIILVSGYSGIGKSSLVAEVHKPIVRQQGYFISGKFDQLGRNIPYASLIQAFQSLMRQLLTESTDKLQNWQDKLLAALGANGQVIIDVIPEVELIIGKQPEVPQLGAVESQKRFHRVFQQFIQVFTQPEHPLVLFLDDLQWADTASLNLIQVLMTNLDSKNLLLIGAYRDNEVSAAHGLINTLSEIEQAGTVINNIVLRPLELTHVQQIVVDTLSNTEETDNLAELLFYKTQGNPFFITQLLNTLSQEKLLKFDFEKEQWVWDIQDILSAGIADKSVVELIASNIQKLPEQTQMVLKLAACIGSRFSLDVLATVSEQSVLTVASALDSALQQGLILPLNNHYKVPLLFASEELEILDFDETRVKYRFLHDRVQQAAYALIPSELKRETHQRIGQLLLKNTSQSKLESNIFDIVNQLNVGIDRLTQSENHELARLNLIAGRKAKASAAYEGAFKYLSVAILLSPDSWQSEYSVTLLMHEEAAEAAYLTGNFVDTEQWADIVLQQAKTILDKVKVYEVKILTKIAQNELLEAVKLGLQVLELLGVQLPEIPTPSDIQLALQETASNLQGRCISDLSNLPLMTDAYQLAAMRMLSITCFPTITAAPALFPLTVFSQVNLSIKYGNAPFSTFAYATYGLILQGFCQDIEGCYQFGKLALNLIEQLNALQLKAKTYFMVAVSTKHGKEHIQHTLPLFQKAYESGLENGDLEYAGHAAVNRYQYAYFAANELTLLSREIASVNDALKFKQAANSNHLATLQQVVLNLTSQVEKPYNLVGVYNEETTLPLQLAANDRIGLHFFYLHKVILCYLFGEYEQAVVNAEQAGVYLDAVAGCLYGPILNFYDSLAKLAVYFDSQTIPQEIQATLQANQDKLKLWSYHAPMNFQNKYDLVEAEKYRLLGQNYQAMEYYDKAIASAAENGYIQEEALANELAAKFYLSQGKYKIAKTYMTDAYYGYNRWGAVAKVKDLEKRYPDCIIYHVNTNIQLDKHPTITGAINKTTVSTSSTSQILDLATVIKASSAIQSEINLENLPSTLLHIIIENTGAQKGCIILEKDNHLLIEAIDIDDQLNHIVVQSTPVEQSADIPISIINYVARTQQILVLNHAKLDQIYSQDPYIQQHQSKSILCVPILYQTKFIGIIYLENNLTISAFTAERLSLIKILASQAAIAIKNARLLAHEQEKTELLQKSETELRQKSTDLEQALIKLQNTQSQLIQTEKISALGQMVAGIAHEVNNPVSFISGNLSHTKQYVKDLIHLLTLYQNELPNPGTEITSEIENVDLEYLIKDLLKMLDSMKIGTDRIKEIMQSLRNYSRTDGNEKKAVDIHEGINSTLIILSHRLKSKPERPAIEIIKSYGDLSLVECFPGQLNQVFTNLIANAIDAIDESNLGKSYTEIEKKPNQIRITTSLDNQQVKISIADNGPGMPESVRNQIFQAFFTTKPEGKGTGLGLSISYEIITQKHGGTIECISSLGQGTEFVIQIPVLGE